MSEIRELKTEDQSYIQEKIKEQEELLDADSKVYEDIKAMIGEQQAEKGKSEEDEEEAERKIKEYLKAHNEGKEKNEYLVRGAELQCTCGSHTRKLNLSPCHGIYIKGNPVVNEMDCISGEEKNITWFGICSNENKEAKRIIVTGQNGEKMNGYKCEPQLVGLWMDSYDGVRIAENVDSAQVEPEDCQYYNTVTVGSFLVCQRGGIISPVNSGQDRPVEEKEFVEGWNAYRRVMELETKQIKGDKNEDIKNTRPEPSELGALDKLDLIHSATGAQVVGFLEILRRNISEEKISDHYEKNLQVLTDAETKEPTFFVSNQYIENQNKPGWEDVKLGIKDMNYAGCEVMATYNARLALGENMTAKELAELISEYEGNGLVLQGGWGVSPKAVYNYFKEREYDVEMVTSRNKEDINAIGDSYDTIIISFFNNQDDIMKEIHTINISKEGNEYICHNAGTSERYGSLWEAVLKVSGGDAKPISIIGINRKENNDADESP